MFGDPVTNSPDNLQIEFSLNFGLIEKQKDLAQKALDESEDLFQSLLQKTFKGE